MHDSRAAGRFLAMFITLALFSLATACTSTGGASSVTESANSEFLDIARTDLCVSNSELRAMAGKLISFKGTFSLVTGVTGEVTDSSCPKPRRVELVTSFYTHGDGTVDSFFKQISRLCSGSPDPCSVKADVQAIGEIKLYEGQPLLELKHVVAKSVVAI